MGIFESLGLYESVVIVALFGLCIFAYNQEKRIKVQDRQFRTLLSRLNELTNRDVDDFSSNIVEDDL